MNERVDQNTRVSNFSDIDPTVASPTAITIRHSFYSLGTGDSTYYRMYLFLTLPASLTFLSLPTPALQLP
ncbi:hypothetical protein BDZ94DRAFT_1277705 [Collybia nuda]|uniref:Uncharacterized protein n=1 Tax=Collybia nuda TaxID=64659 RepID=A0A9P5XRZ1_9AGAR|nr:hypothetical protein BDZ94DRAFT_1277705 [Collybia nuda]